MAKEFGKANNVKRLIFPTLVLVGLVWIPFTVFMFVVALEDLNVEKIGFTALISLTLLYMVVNHLQKLYEYPHVLIDGNIMVLTEPFLKQRVYSLDKITKVYSFQKSIILIHLGWPSIVTLNKMNENQVKELIKLLKSS